MRLVLLRHAKAAPTGPDGDRNRPLLEEGRRQVASVSARLQALGWWPDKAIVSTALRARQTHEALVPPIPAEVDEEIYTGGALAIRRRLLETGGGLVVVIGHNPSLSELASRLTGFRVGLEPAAAGLLRHPGDALGPALLDERNWELAHLVQPYA
jgi:phosphohistidine phosphatase